MEFGVEEDGLLLDVGNDIIAEILERDVTFGFLEFFQEIVGEESVLFLAVRVRGFIALRGRENDHVALRSSGFGFEGNTAR